MESTGRSTGEVAAPASNPEGIMLSLGYCDVTASRQPVQPTWREKLAGIHDVTALEAVSEREAVGREIIATFRVRPGDPIFCVVEASLPEPDHSEFDPTACACGDGSCDGCDREARR